MIIVIGHLILDSADRDRHVELSSRAVESARNTPGCLDFSVSADSLDPHRVNVSERWTDRESLDAFRGSGPDTEGDAPSILAFHVDEYEVRDH